jgi:uncharacterized protein YcnI
VFGIFKMKALFFGMLLASPAFAVWTLRSSEAPVSQAEAVVRVPVEVITKGSAPQWVYVEVGNQTVPEPGMISLFALSTLLLVFRRQRG